MEGYTIRKARGRNVWNIYETYKNALGKMKTKQVGKIYPWHCVVGCGYYVREMEDGTQSKYESLEEAKRSILQWNELYS